MNKKLLIIICIGLLTGCQNNNKQQKEETPDESSTTTELTDETNTETPLDPEFTSYLNKIPDLELPYSTACFSDYKNSPEIDKELKMKFLEGEWEWPHRRIPTNSEFIAVMNLAPADVVLPIIKTYKKSGEIISSQQMFFDYCGGEPGYYHSEHIIIKPNLVITHIDSTWTHQLDSLENEIEGTEKLEVKNFDYRILADGKIVKVE